MSIRPDGFGLTAELDDKTKAKYSEDQESEVAEWIKNRTGHEFTGRGQDDFREFLLNGSVLCALINSFQVPGISCEPNDTSGIELLAMRDMKEEENIGMFLTAAKNFGVRQDDLFQTSNIRDNSNMAQVLRTLLILGRLAYSRGVSGPMIAMM
ncbi:transgelin-3-like [Styela clava]